MESRSNVVLILVLSSQVSQLTCRSHWHIGTYLLKLLLAFTQIRNWHKIRKIRYLENKGCRKQSSMCEIRRIASFDRFVVSIYRNRYPTRMGTEGQAVKFLFFPILSYFFRAFLFSPIFQKKFLFLGVVQSCHIYFLYKVELCTILVCFLFRYTFFRFFSKCGDTCED